MIIIGPTRSGCNFDVRYWRYYEGYKSAFFHFPPGPDRISFLFAAGNGLNQEGAGEIYYKIWNKEELHSPLVLLDDSFAIMFILPNFPLFLFPFFTSPRFRAQNKKLKVLQYHQNTSLSCSVQRCKLTNSLELSSQADQEVITFLTFLSRPRIQMIRNL